MRRPSVVILSVAVLAGCLCATAPATADQADQALADAQRKTEAFVTAMVDFTKDVRLDEASLSRVLDNMASLNALKDDAESEALTDKAFHDGHYDIGVILDDPEYVSWARGRGLGPKEFLKDLMRLVSLSMRSEIQASAARMKTTMPETQKQFEAMRSQMGEKAYQQAMESMKASVAALEQMATLVKRLPAPSEAEARLLEQHRDEIEQAMQSGDQDPMAGGGAGEAEPE